MSQELAAAREATLLGGRMIRIESTGTAIYSAPLTGPGLLDLDVYVY